MSPSSLVIGTAGHIDHGKTSLIRALTGVDLDRLPEEKTRGITIALGFTHLDLPSGRRAAFVDVPGHERLVRTMIAGATGLDAALLCVSAAEGVMPQTREHLAILDLLGVRQGVVALTMADLVDEELLELARLEVAEILACTALEGAPIVATSAGPTPRGLGELVAALDALHPAQRPVDGLFRLPIDRAFVQRGFGTVVTGTVWSGGLSDGEEVEVLPGGLRARVRGLQVHGEKVGQTAAGLRTAVNLAGLERDDLGRGFVLMRPGEGGVASVLDARYRPLGEAPEDGCSVRLLIGTAEVMATLSALESQPGEDGAIYVQLRTEAPLVALPGDRFILRRPSPAETLGGGTILDPWARRARRRDYLAVMAELRALEAGDSSVLLARAGDAGLLPVEVARRGIAGGRLLGDRVLAEARAVELEAILCDLLAGWHQAHPLAPGAPRRELRQGPLGHLGPRAFDALLARLAEEGRLVLEGPRARLPDFQALPDAALAAALRALETRIRAAGLEGLGFDALVAEAGDMLGWLSDQGVLERIGARVLHRDGLADLEARVRAFFAEHEALTPGDFKALTGLSRQYAIPLLEWLDLRRITVRDADARRLR